MIHEIKRVRKTWRLKHLEVTEEVFLYQGNEFYRLGDIFRAIFKDQGEFYGRLGIPRGLARLFNLHPEDDYFNPDACNGWETFLKILNVLETEDLFDKLKENPNLKVIPVLVEETEETIKI